MKHVAEIFLFSPVLACDTDLVDNGGGADKFAVVYLRAYVPLAPVYV